LQALRAASISPQNAIPSAGQQAATLAQHLALNPYSHQPEMPLGHYGNLISYPFMAQCYNPFMLSAFQQVFPTGNHQSLVDMLMQYKTQTTAPPVPPPSAYGFGGGAVSSNNFPLNPTSAANSYEDVLSSQFNESNHLASSLQQQVNHEILLRFYNHVGVFWFCLVSFLCLVSWNLYWSIRFYLFLFDFGWVWLSFELLDFKKIGAVWFLLFVRSLFRKP